MPGSKNHRAAQSSRFARIDHAMRSAVDDGVVSGVVVALGASGVFAQSVGMTPYRYVVHLRLQRALELMRDGRHGLAEIAAATGLAD